MRSPGRRHGSKCRARDELREYEIHGEPLRTLYDARFKRKYPPNCSHGKHQRALCRVPDVVDTTASAPIIHVQTVRHESRNVDRSNQRIMVDILPRLTHTM